MKFQCSSASRKFLNGIRSGVESAARGCFSALQRAENSSTLVGTSDDERCAGFSALQRAENSSTRNDDWARATRLSFSALQRAENSSTPFRLVGEFVPTVFQCSSASRKFLNSIRRSVLGLAPTRFSALQRAENSSTKQRQQRRIFREMFQCSSASRKFLNCAAKSITSRASRFQCSSASRKFLNADVQESEPKFEQVSVLFSEPKIPQPVPALSDAPGRACFSALQRAENSSTFQLRPADNVCSVGFSALQRAENSSTLTSKPSARASGRRFQCSSASRKFLNLVTVGRCSLYAMFQCSSASRKFLNQPAEQRCDRICVSFSALQRAENSSTGSINARAAPVVRFQCSSASRKFLNRRGRSDTALESAFQCSSASRKFLNATPQYQRAC